MKYSGRTTVLIHGGGHSRTLSSAIGDSSLKVFYSRRFPSRGDILLTLPCDQVPLLEQTLDPYMHDDGIRIEDIGFFGGINFLLGND
ncbi:MAG: hypothetical protein GF368_03590 [Candidatus Aenigmarchaeota archaeon]|nr:hypothetical protein [Candidatus Aenigmarchaeota archaeon]